MKATLKQCKPVWLVITYDGYPIGGTFYTKKEAMAYTYGDHWKIVKYVPQDSIRVPYQKQKKKI